ncbi:MAG TPA: CAP domain-containing protein [Patescibacteria group bacterium]|nr:CAP domain-containing protein [Patescibacteria group bacterium]
MQVLIDLFVPHSRNNYRAKALHLSSLSVFLLIIMFTQLLLAVVVKTFPGVLGIATSITADELVALTNSQRQANGLPSLSLNQNLVQAAALKGGDMLAKSYWAHTSPDGATPWTFIKQAGYSYIYAGENLARDFMDTGSVINAWMNSPSHRDNVLSSRYRDIGIAVIHGNFQGQDTTLVVQMFGTTASSAVAQVIPKAPVVAEAQAEVLQEPEPVQEVEVASESSQASESAVVITSQPKASVLGRLIARLPGLSDFTLTKSISISLTLILLLAIVIDTIFITRHRIVRLGGKGLAHIIFLAILLILLLGIQPGLIL